MNPFNIFTISYIKFVRKRVEKIYAIRVHFQFYFGGFVYAFDSSIECNFNQVSTCLKSYFGC